MTKGAIAIIATALIGLAGIAAYVFSPNVSVERVDRTILPKLADLEAAALDQCLCAMAGEADCGTRFANLSASLEKEESSTSSMPSSTEVTCFPQLGENACVVTRQSLVDGNHAYFTCTDPQYREIDRVFAEAGLGPNGETDKAMKAARDRIEAMREEVRRQRQK